jgi:hypothetical protein
MQSKRSCALGANPVTGWRHESACLKAGPELFFGPDGESPSERTLREAAASVVCAGCPVVAQCLAWSLDTAIPYGVWGGVGEVERQDVLAGLRAVLSGCQDPAISERRAAHLIPTGIGDGERWNVPARRVLALLLHAAAVANRSMRDVMRWIQDSSNTSRDEVVEALLAGPTGAPQRAATARAFWATQPRTRNSLAATMLIPFGWLSEERVGVTS